MDEVRKYVVELFGELPDWAKLAAFLLVVALAVWLGVRKALADRELDAKQKALDEVTKERDNLLSRKKALDRIDTFVWMKPDVLGANQFVPPHERKARFLALCNLKGGVGKTTLALNLGATLARAGKTVLLVDLDFQGTLSNQAGLEAIRLKEYRDREWSTVGLLKNRDFNGDVRLLMLSALDIPGCKVLVASDRLEIVDYEQQSRFFLDSQHEVRFLLQRLLHAAPVSQEFDYVLFDCPPRMSTACVNALTCADYVLVPTGLSQLEIEAVPRTLYWLAQLHTLIHATLLGVVITRGQMRSGKLITNERRQLGRLKENIQKHHPVGDFVFKAMIPDSAAIHHMMTAHKIPAICSDDVGTWFGAVARELERKVTR